MDIASNYVISFKKRRFNFCNGNNAYSWPPKLLSVAPNVFALNYDFIEVAY